MDRRSRFSPDPVLQSLRARAVSQPPRSSGVPEYPAFAFPEVGTSPHQRSAQSPARERPWGQRLGRSPAAVSRVPQGQLRSASFSASEYPQENDIWRPGGSHFPSTFEEDDEESLDAWTDNFTGQPRSWANTESRYRPHQVPGARSRSLVPTHGLSATGFNGPSSDWGDRGLSISIDQRFLDGYPTSRLNGSRAQSLQGTSSMPAALAHRGSQAEISNLSPFSRDRLASRLGNDDLPGGYDHWSSIMNSMREEEPGSGATSRRHSVSVVPRTRGVGFAASTAPGGDDTTSTRMPVNASMAMFSDEELAGNFGVLNLNNNSPATDLLPTGTSSFPYSSSRLGAHAYGRARNNGIHGYPNLDTHLQRTRTPSDGRSPIGDGTFGSGKPTNMDQLGVALHQGARSGNASPLAASHSRDSSPSRQDGRELSPSGQADPQFYMNDSHPYERQMSEANQGVGIDDVPRSSRLVLLEFKLARKEVFFCDANLRVARGDRMIVEGDRGKDIGVVVDPDVERSWLSAQRHGSGSETMGSNLHTKAKRAYAIAGPQEAQDLAKKEEDEQKALQLCQNKVRQKKLPMQVVDCEFQWDRRKLTFYFIAESRIDFRDLVRELFRLYKTRIWMSCISGPLAGPTANVVY